MAKPSIMLITALRNAAKKIQRSGSYQWGHMGSCNCGFLAQEISKLNSDEIHERAMERYGDWNEQLNDYCPSSGLLMDDLITNFLDAGLTLDDLKYLEKLSDAHVLSNLSTDRKHLVHNNKSDVVDYLHSWADLLEQEWIAKISLQDLAKQEYIQDYV